MERGSCVFTGRGDNRSYGDQKSSKKPEVIIYVLIQGVWLFSQFLFLNIFTKLCIETENKDENKDENTLVCFESSILTSEHFLCLQTQL